MTWFKRTLKETATYWGPPAINAFGDRSSYPSPATLSCHWEERSMLFIDTAGVQKHSHAVVLCSGEIEVNGRLYYGDSDEDNPDDQPGADVIRQVERVKTIRGDVVAYTAML